MATKADRYEGIDGLKAYAIIGIALMHVLANGEYIRGWWGQAPMWSIYRQLKGRCVCLV